MPKKPRNGGKFSFGEWICGGTIQDYLGPIPAERVKKPPRKVFSIDVTTDDEDDTQSINISFPNPSSTKPSDNQQEEDEEEEAVYAPTGKKVRFNRAATRKPLKSAMKKRLAFSDESVMGSSDFSEEESDESSEASSEERWRSKKQAKGQQRTNKAGKMKAGKKQFRPVESDTDSESQSQLSMKKRKGGSQKPQRQNAKQKVKFQGGNGSDTDDEESNAEPEAGKKSKKGKKKFASISSASSSTSADASSEALESDSRKQRRLSKKQLQRAKADLRGDIPSHVRRPHLLGPVRTEVVQTERVIETPEDPSPNAFYDPRANIMRVYHGPVWGTHPNQGLYPLKDARNVPLPMGMPHPAANPYYFGQPRNDLPEGKGPMPITEGMPINAYSAHAPPPPHGWYPYGAP